MSACQAIEDACGVTVDRRRSPRCAGCCTAASGSRATPCTSTCCTRPTSSATRRDRAGPRPPDVVERGLRLKKAGNAILEADRRPGDPPGQRPGRRLLPRPDDGGPGRAGRAAAPGPRRRAGHRRPGWPASTSPTSSSIATCSRCRPRTAYPIEAATGRVAPAGWTFPAAEFSRARHRAPGAALHRAARDAGRPGATSPARWPGTRSTPASCRRSPGRPRPPPASARPAATRSAASSSAPSRRSTRSTRRCGSSTQYEPPDPPFVRRAARGRGRPRRQRGTARAALPPLPARRGRPDRGGGIVPPTSQNQAAIEADLRESSRRACTWTTPS